MSKDTQIKRVTNREIQASERREQILDAAKQLFVAQGYHAASMRAINKKVGMSEALTYHYFPGGKLEILHTVIREGHEKRMKDIDEFVKSFQKDMTLREALFLLAHKISDIFIKDDDITQILIREKNLLDKDQYAFITHVTQQLINTMSSFLSKHAAEGNIRDMDFALAIQQFTYNFTTISIFGFDFTSEDYDQYIEKIVNFTIKLWSK